MIKNLHVGQILKIPAGVTNRYKTEQAIRVTHLVGDGIQSRGIGQNKDEIIEVRGIVRGKIITIEVSKLEVF